MGSQIDGASSSQTQLAQPRAKLILVQEALLRQKNYLSKEVGSYSAALYCWRCNIFLCTSYMFLESYLLINLSLLLNLGHLKSDFHLEVLWNFEIKYLIGPLMQHMNSSNLQIHLLFLQHIQIKLQLHHYQIELLLLWVNQEHLPFYPIRDSCFRCARLRSTALSFRSCVTPFKLPNCRYHVLCFYVKPNNSMSSGISKPECLPLIQPQRSALINFLTDLINYCSTELIVSVEPVIEYKN